MRTPLEMHAREPKEILRTCLPLGSAGVLLFSARNTSRKWKMYHDDYAISIIERCDAGCHEIRYRGRTVARGAKHVMVFEPGEAHRMLCAARGDLHLIFVKRRVLTGTLGDAPGKRALHFGCAGCVDNALHGSLVEFVKASWGESSLPERRSLLTAAIGLLVKRLGESPRPDAVTAAERPLIDVRNYLRNRVSEPVSLRDLERIAGLSRFHLVRSFANRFGLPPHQYLVHVRLALARRAIALGQEPDILAFADQSHFIRRFKETYGITPAAFAGLFRGKSLARVHNAYIVHDAEIAGEESESRLRLRG